MFKKSGIKNVLMAASGLLAAQALPVLASGLLPAAPEQRRLGLERPLKQFAL
jgi:hypothetical protein